jgi:uncharacterized protein (TIGR02246 family)
MTSSTALEAAEQIRDTFDDWFDATCRKDVDAIMSHFAPDAVDFEHTTPLQYKGVDAIRKVCQAGFDRFEGPIEFEVQELNITACDDIAFSHGLVHIVGQTTDGNHVDSWTRATWALRKTRGKWLCTHQHVSAPFDPQTQQAVFNLTP